MDILISKKKEKINKNNDYVKEVICRGYYLKVTFVQNVGDTPSRFRENFHPIPERMGFQVTLIVNELRGIVIKLFYHTLALLHFTFLFHIPDTSIWMGQKHAFSPAF